jgi:ABC-type lipopolysaccharide export system ATPase subunit
MSTAAAADAGAHRLEARGLLKSYGSRKVVDGVRLSVRSGEVVGLLGPNGAGKTTSFYMIVGLIRPDGGEITIERRRVEIARALATQPRFILLDEPFAGIDPIAVIEIQRIIGFLKERGIGVLITDHNVRETLGICDRAYIISDGRVLAEGTPAEIVANADVRKVYLGEHFRM